MAGKLGNGRTEGASEPEVRFVFDHVSEKQGGGGITVRAGYTVCTPLW